MTALLLAACVAAAPLAFGTSGAASARAPGPDRATQTYSREWKRLRSEHFLAAGNADYGSMRRVVVELEGFRRALLRSLPALRVTPGVPTTIVVFKDEASFARFRPRDEAGRPRDRVAAYFSSGRDANYLVVPMHREPARTFHYLFHEFTHFIVRQNLGDVPEWLNEGLAEFYSTFRAIPREGRAILGEPPQNRLAAIRSGRLLPMRELLAMDAAARAKASADVQQMFYAQAWALVHFLTLGDDGRHRPGIAAYLAALRKDPSLEGAVSSAFGMPLDALEREAARYAQRASYPKVVIEESEGAVTVRTTLEAMLETDVAALQRALLGALDGTGVPRR